MVWGKCPQASGSNAPGYQAWQYPYTGSCMCCGLPLSPLLVCAHDPHDAHTVKLFRALGLARAFVSKLRVLAFQFPKAGDSEPWCAWQKETTKPTAPPCTSLVTFEYLLSFRCYVHDDVSTPMRIQYLRFFPLRIIVTYSNCISSRNAPATHAPFTCAHSHPTSRRTPKIGNGKGLRRTKAHVPLNHRTRGLTKLRRKQRPGLFQNGARTPASVLGSGEGFSRSKRAHALAPESTPTPSPHDDAPSVH